MMAEAPPIHSTASTTEVVTEEENQMPTLKLRLKKTKTDKKVKWTNETVDNENMGKKSSKCCCIYEKPRAFGESSDESDDDDECEHCRGHKSKWDKHPPGPQDDSNRQKESPSENKASLPKT